MAALLPLTRRVAWHEGGLVRLGPPKKSTVLFEDAKVLTYGAVGSDQGTDVKLAIADAAGQSMKLKARTMGSAEVYERIRDQVASVVAAKMEKRLEVESFVPWTEGATLSRETIRFWRTHGIETRVRYDFGGHAWTKTRLRRPRGIEREEITASLADVTYLLNGGWFHLFVPGEERSVLQISVDADNFYPGYFLLQRLADELRKSS